MTDRYETFVAALREQENIAAALALLHWDQETQLPSGAAAARARQIGTLAGILHERQTDAGFLGLVDELAGDLESLTPPQQVDVRETKWRLDRRRRLDTALIRERARLRSEAQTVWVTARQENDFPALAPYLSRLVTMERRVAQAIDSAKPPYDVLLEGFEPGATSTMVEQVLGQLHHGLVPLISRLDARLRRRPLDASALCGSFPLSAQRRFNHTVAERLGVDFRLGRLDESAHPFTITVGNDIRFTIRIDPTDLRCGLFATIHEAGHAMYEQGLDPEAYGTPRGKACSMAIHESQSRLWENLVGRSEAFWRWLLPLAATAFPNLSDRSLAAAVLAANESRPSLIRTEADELTYNLHIILRFDLERALVAGDLMVPDLPRAWRDKMQTYLGVEPPDDRAGVLQDVHWAEGLFGYFPTYTLGNLYAAQLYETAQSRLGSFEDAFTFGNFRPLLDWLHREVHRPGQTWRAPILIAQATGEAPDARALLAHLTRKVEWLEVH